MFVDALQMLSGSVADIVDDLGAFFFQSLQYDL